MVVQIRDTRERLSLLQTADLVPLANRGPETYRQSMLFQSASIQSTLYIRSMDPGATLRVTYYQFTTGTQFEEIQALQSHPLVTQADVIAAGPGGYHHILTVTRLHDKPWIDCEVVGGNVEFGVYVTLKSDFSSDVDSALHLDGDTWSPTSDKGLPIVCLDEDTGLLQFVRCKNGLLGFTSDVGDPWREVGDTVISSATSPIDLVQFTTAVVFTRNVTSFHASCCAEGVAKLYFDTDLVGVCRTGAGHPDGRIQFSPSQPAAAGTVVKITYELEETRLAAVPISGLIYGSEIST